MASPENQSSIETPSFHSSFADSWITEAFSRDNQALTIALQKSISDSFVNPVAWPAPETSPKRQRTANPPPLPLTEKISKRKPRASKRSQTTFITADPADFRQKVQQVTGFSFGEGQVPVSPILKPEPQRPGNRLHNVAGPGFLPTLDTSAVLLDHQQPFSGAVVGSSLDCEIFPSFPTLDSWKV
ncbi:Peroxisomal membrane 22 kDa family protein isoform 1 [Hibiscus syriacus]|uniref:Peroxisomal membrane 22 kDa family protein isoform 1 n=1 Tax=Hibiscus syriacus TaxID=106335 RepID=A0A6A3C8R8_HIBSY|nr:calmodulin-binding protein 25-like [Hibiscus syriacus]KAE8725186.1 Peroxisomal membrane 22 kDa family protein isoform 1 [Hibiscus syriacus]